MIANCISWMRVETNVSLHCHSFLLTRFIHDPAENKINNFLSRAKWNVRTAKEKIPTAWLHSVVSETTISAEKTCVDFIYSSIGFFILFHSYTL
jgi:hypothetical protein